MRVLRIQINRAKEVLGAGQRELADKLTFSKIRFKSQDYIYDTNIETSPEGIGVNILSPAPFRIWIAKINPMVTTKNFPYESTGERLPAEMQQNAIPGPCKDYVDLVIEIMKEKLVDNHTETKYLIAQSGLLKDGLPDATDPNFTNRFLKLVNRAKTNGNLFPE